MHLGVRSAVFVQGAVARLPQLLYILGAGVYDSGISWIGGLRRRALVPSWGFPAWGLCWIPNRWITTIFLKVNVSNATKFGALRGADLAT